MSRQHPNPNTRSSLLNQKAFLASAYQELGKELSSTYLKTIGSYTLGRTIGEGTYGKVRLATHRLTGLKVAIKQIPKTSSALGQLTREIHHHRRLHHPNIIQLYEVIATESSIWMASELCPGGELYDYLVENQALNEPETRRIFGQLCLALAYCHEKGIVHRDLKLENILLDEKCNVKLGDFGFTREFEKDRLMDTFCGTTGYAAPEMLRGERYRGEEVDIWSLGIILYALLFGALPFDDDDEEVMKQKIWKGDYEMPKGGDDGVKVGEEARDLITQILQSSPTKRPSIKSILSHPWFSKVFREGIMSTVEEDGTSPLKGDGVVEEEDESDEENAEMEIEAQDLADETARPADAEESSKEDPTALPKSSPSQPSNDTESSNKSSSASIATSSSASSTSSISSSDKLTSTDLEKGLVGSTLSTASQSSFYSAVSDSESSSASASDIRSGKSGKSHRSDDTTPTTDDGDDGLESSSSPKNSSELAKEGEVSSESLIGISQKNSSQTTIKREGSSGTIASSSSKNYSSSKNSTARPLPTHHESPGSPEVEEEGGGSKTTSSKSEGAEQGSKPHSASNSISESQRVAASSPTPFGSMGANNLTKRSSQSSSKGHHRTPSRTKRRSLSSGALSDHNPPSLASRPVDYISLMTHLQPALFSTTLEQNLLHQLSSIGMDVGQIVHSIINDACDASGAMWWLLKRKAEEKEAYGGHSSTALDPSSSSPQLDAPPVPPKDPNRRSSREELNAMTDSQPRDGLPKSAQDSFRRRLDASTIQALAEIGSKQEEERSSRSRSRSGEETSALPRSSSLSEALTAEGTSTTTPSGTLGTTSATSLDHSSLLTTGGNSTPDSSNTSQKASTKSKSGSSKAQLGATNLPSTAMPTKPKRNRTNSFSMKQLAGKLGGGGGHSNVPTVKVGDEELPVERSKSPVSNLFGKRNTQGILSPKSQSPSSLQKELMPSKISATRSTEKLSSPNVNSSPSGKSIARSPRGSEKDFDRLKSMAAMSTSHEHASPTRMSSKAANRLGGSASPAEVQAASQLAASGSVETFSTMSSGEDHGNEGRISDSPSHPKGSRTRSSFLSTVRTWLGSEDKQMRKKRKGAAAAGASGSGSKLATKGLPSSLGHSGPGSASQNVPRTGSARARASPYQTASPSTLSRRSTNASGGGSGPKSPHRGSLSRRGSTGSAHLIALLDGKATSPPGRPSNYRRQSAGSITPTATMYGDVNWELGGSLSGSGLPRGSRPSSSNSMRRAPTSGSLHAKTGSASSSGSLMRLQQQSSMSHHHHFSQASGEYAGSLRGLHGRRPSDGGTTVRRHRPYTAPHSGSNSRRASSVASRGSSPGPSEAVEGDIGDVTTDTELAATNTGRGSARTSLDSQGKPLSPISAFSNSGSNHAHSVFVAHKSRSPYKPPSANPSIHGMTHRATHSASSTHSHSRRGSENAAIHQKQLPTSPPQPVAATWRRSWGRPPPSWMGTVDDEPSTEEVIAANRPKLRDVFAAKEGEDEWIDEDEEPTYSGGLGQLNSTNSSSNSGTSSNFFGNYDSTSRTGGGAGDSPFATRTSKNEYSNPFGMSKGPNSSLFTSNSFNMPGGSGLLNQGRYAGVRSLFQPPSLGREISPKMISISNNNDSSNIPSTLSTTSSLSSMKTSTLKAMDEESDEVEESETKIEDSNSNSASAAVNLAPGGTARRGAQPPTFKQITIEEEEEDE